MLKFRQKGETNRLLDGEEALEVPVLDYWTNEPEKSNVLTFETN